jgi:hypothetical protein
VVWWHDGMALNSDKAQILFRKLRLHCSQNVSVFPKAYMRTGFLVDPILDGETPEATPRAIEL